MIDTTLTSPFFVNPSIEQAETLPATFYRSKESFEEVKERIFAKSWLYVADSHIFNNKISQYPFTLLEGVLDEPLVLTESKTGEKRCLSNVCTHRGKILVEKPQKGNHMICGYHGRCFGLSGDFQRMPAFEAAQNFPSEKDNLTDVPFKEWMKMLFVSLDPAFDFEEAIQPMLDRMHGFPLDKLQFQPEASQTYYVNANWALYCDNFLEGFHVPFVHPGLNEALDFKNYAYEVFPYCNLQIGIAKEGETHFDLPASSPDYGRKVFAYYFWMFPNLMFNFYPWGLSLNIIEPLSHDKTKVIFRNYVYPDTPYDWKDTLIDITELEDESVVESVQKGIQSRFYDRGRFSPSMERCVHHFHSLIGRFMNA